MTDIIDPGDLIRAAHLAASLLPAGFYAFMLLVARPVAVRSGAAGMVPGELRIWVVRVLRWTMPVALLTGIAWLCLEAVSMSGEPFAAAMTPDVLGRVLRSTLFGQLWIGRAALLALLAAWVVRPMNAQKRPYSDAVGLLLSGAFALSMAWVGHAAGIEGAEGWALLLSQIAHLAATAGWLGALPPLAVTLALSRNRPATLAFAAAVTRRFSPLGMICIAVLAASGAVNGWVLVGSIPGLLGTGYGHLLLIKLGLAAAMLLLAAINRFALTPAFDLEPRRTVRALENTITLETALGIGVLVAVGALGAATPATHEQPLWPFSATLSLDPVFANGRLDPGFVIAISAAVAGLVALAGGIYYRSRIAAAAGVLAALGASNFIVWDMEVPAYPTSFMTSPIAFTADAVARGGRIYADDCTACHGQTGNGDGPAATRFPRGEATVVAHLLDHPVGDLFWFIGNGIPGTPMPGFSGEIPPAQRWTLIQYLRAQAEATAVAAMTWHVSTDIGAPAPEFSFQIGDRPAESLADQRGKSAVLLVLYSRPGSNARLAQLAAAAGGLPLRIVALPLQASDARGDHPDEAGLLARPSPDIVAAYSLYGWRIGGDAPHAPRHTEFLIDRSGNLRARWHLSDANGWDDLARLKAQADRLAREPFRPVEPAHHVHG